MTVWPMPFYRCHPAAFNDGMLGLSLEERGAYATLVNAMYIAGGPVRDDVARCVALLGCTPATWAKVRTGLLKKGRLEEVEINGRPYLRDERTMQVIAEYGAHVEEMRRKGRAGGKKTQQKQSSKTIKALAQAHALADAQAHALADAQAPAKPYEKEKESTTVDTSSGDKSPADGGSPKRARPKRPIPDDWAASEIDRAYSAKNGFSPGETDRMAERFANHARSQDRRCADWQQAWRNWVLEERQRHPPKPKRAIW